MEEVKNCRTCKHSIFDRIFGEYSCAKSQLKVFPAKRIKSSLFHILQTASLVIRTEDICLTNLSLT